MYTCFMKSSYSLTVTVRPSAQKTKRKPDSEDGSWRIDLQAPPEDNKANLELIRFLAKELDVPRVSIEILSGLTGRRKVVRVQKRIS